ncbi:hypothetical protein niasHS_008582 [Heterodera schachtii]|uniref:Protein kinase domain-containing protein n=1 Tax=Heterodera schachtii TaxID=97005 RepID=A0ABD2J893_HETSC
MSIERLCVLFSRMELKKSDEGSDAKHRGDVSQPIWPHHYFGWCNEQCMVGTKVCGNCWLESLKSPPRCHQTPKELAALNGGNCWNICEKMGLLMKRLAVAFKAPELLQTRDYDPFNADVWALGIVCYILLTDTFPFDIAKDISQILEKMRSQNYQFPSRLAIIASSREAINTILAFDPSDRPTIFDVSNLSWITHHLNARMTAQINKKSHTEKRYTRKFYHDYASGLERIIFENMSPSVLGVADHESGTYFDKI